MNPDIATRRGWILRVGGAAVLNGIGAAELDGEAARLPPGLYEPSLQHLAHSLKARIEPAPGAPPVRYFNAHDFSLVRILAALVLGEEPEAPVISEIAGWIDLIAGRSAEVRAAARALSPAHRRMAIDYYGEETVRQLETEDPQALCREGLASLKETRFETLGRAAQLAHLDALEERGDPFLVWFKRRALDGFYTSRQGLQELDYKGNAFYAEPPGCDHRT